MKKIFSLSNIKNKLDVKKFLIINYIAIFLMLYIIVRLSLISWDFVLKNFVFKNRMYSFSTLASIYNKDFNKIDTSVLEEMGAWVEILDEKKRVIYVKGIKKDKIMQYDEKQLITMSSFDNYEYSKNPYMGQFAFVEGKNKEQYIFILKFDRRKTSCSMIYVPNLNDKKEFILILKTYGILVLFVIFYLLIGLYIYSRISSRFITIPLKGFVNGIKKIKQLDYSVSSNANGLKELKEVEDEFNEMAIKLQQVKEENRRIDESKKRLLVDISHDLKTPITSIQGFSKLILEENISDLERDKFLNIIYNKSVYAALLIEDLFQLSKLEDSAYNIVLKEENFSEWLRRLIVEYYEEFKNKSFNLEIDITEEPIIFKFDERLMKRSVSNILNNSLKHNECHTTIKILCYLENNNIFLKIGDNGEAIEQEIRDKIFEPFVKSETKKSEGSGLGLAITKKIIERHGGTIELTYTESEKNLFIICLPMN